MYSQLPPKAASTRPTRSSESHPPTCSICFDALSAPHCPKTTAAESPITIKACTHVFGNGCLAQWMAYANTCPVCRIEFFRKDEDDEKEEVRQHFALGVYAGPEFLARMRNLTVRAEQEQGRGSDG
ncbi:hypothetical protein BDV95DRAFT_191642 [Massariosphaeria phaeospora]|uniref:RING-type domain-containing protein n=1 Tax=Massariosphaeria phaeospora TaxID=100035 RepID=A0A7C8M2S7_9PLEO|nr:hypothetical protein BDV95DRAFT_191642 [Massariosphaeria phaeospora]